MALLQCDDQISRVLVLCVYQITSMANWWSFIVVSLPIEIPYSYLDLLFCFVTARWLVEAHSSFLWLSFSMWCDGQLRLVLPLWVYYVTAISNLGSYIVVWWPIEVSRSSLNKRILTMCLSWAYLLCCTD